MKSVMVFVDSNGNITQDINNATSFELSIFDKEKLISVSIGRVHNNKNIQNDTYLSEVSDQLKLNYKCRKEDSPDGSNKCNIAKPSKNEDNLNIKKNIRISNKAIGNLRGTDGRMSPKALAIYMYQSESFSVTKELIKYPNTIRKKTTEYEIDKKVLQAEPILAHLYDGNMTDRERRPYLVKRTELERKFRDEAGFDLAPINDRIVEIDNMMDKSVIEESITVYSGTIEPFIDQLPSDPGDEFTLSTYLSTSRLEKVGRGFAIHGATIGRGGIKAKPGAVPSMLKINIQKGQKALFLEDFTEELRDTKKTKWIVGESGKPQSTGNQREVLINRNTRYRVDSKNIINGIKILEVSTI